MPTHQPRKRFGQHFLHDPAVIGRIIASINPKPDEYIVEIGPGQGAITAPLLKAVDHLTAIELDRDLANALGERFGSSIQLYQTDALGFDFSSLVVEQTKLRIVGNLPYNISTPLIFHLLAHATSIQDMHFMLQKEVVSRMAATPNNKTYGRLSVMLGLFCDVEPLFDIGPGAFNPPPKVQSSFVGLKPLVKARYATGSMADLRRVVSSAFSMRRKTVRNSLGAVLTPEDIIQAGVDLKARAENLSLEQYARLSVRLAAKASE